MRIIFLVFFTFLWASVFSQKDTVQKPYHGNRYFGVGFNYTSPAAGLSAKIPFWKNELIQVSFSQRSYNWNYFGFMGWGYSWRFYGAEYQHRFEEKVIGEKHFYIPFVYIGGGLGQTKWNGDYFWYFGNEWERSQEWFGYNLGAGIEFFPAAFKNNIGITSKIGFGSYATANMYGSSNNSGYLMYGGSVFYYLK